MSKSSSLRSCQLYWSLSGGWDVFHVSNSVLLISKRAFCCLWVFVLVHCIYLCLCVGVTEYCPWQTPDMIILAIIRRMMYLCTFNKRIYIIDLIVALPWKVTIIYANMISQFPSETCIHLEGSLCSIIVVDNMKIQVKKHLQHLHSVDPFIFFFCYVLGGSNDLSAANLLFFLL